jgi:hypothetical protein
MQFRMTDGREWSHEFEAVDAAELVVGVRQSWDAFIVANESADGHPGLALRIREAEIDRSLAEKLARPNATNEQRRSWTANANHDRWNARRSLGATGTPSLLELHVHTESGPCAGWLTPIPHNPVAPRLPRTLDADRALSLFSGAEAMVAHHAKLMGLADSVGEAIRTVQFPPLRSV